MNGSFHIPEFNRKNIMTFTDTLKSKGLGIQIEWLKNAKKTVAENESMPAGANGMRILIDDRTCLFISKATSSFNDKGLTPSESKKVLEALFEMGWVGKPEFSYGIICSCFHTVVLVILIALQWHDSSRTLLVGLCTASIVLIATGIAMWVPNAQKGLKPSKFTMVIFCVGIFCTVPSSLLHIVLIRALMKKSFYVSAITLYPELATVAPRVEPKPEIQLPTHY